MAVLGAIGRGLGKGAKWGAAGAIGGGLGLGVNPMLGLAVGNAIRNIGKGFGKRDTTITAGEKPNAESKKSPKVKGDLTKTVDFHTAILQIDKTTRATYLQTLKNNHEIIHIQKMLAGPGAARAKELRMESSLGGGPIIIQNFMGGGGEKEKDGFPWWMIPLGGMIAAMVLGDPFMGKSRWTKTKTTLKGVEERLTKTFNDRLKAVEDRLKVAEEGRVNRGKALNERLKFLETKIKIGEALNRIGRGGTLAEDRLRFSDAMRDSESRIRERLNELYRARESSYRTELLESRGRTTGSKGAAASLFENIRNDIKSLRDTIQRTRGGPTGKVTILEQLETIRRSVGEGKAGRESIADNVRSLRDTLQRTRGAPTGKVTILEQLRIIDEKLGKGVTGREGIGNQVRDIKTTVDKLAEPKPTGGRGTGLYELLSRDINRLSEILTGEKVSSTTKVGPQRARQRLGVGKGYFDIVTKNLRLFITEQLGVRRGVPLLDSFELRDSLTRAKVELGNIEGRVRGGVISDIWGEVTKGGPSKPLDLKAAARRMTATYRTGGVTMEGVKAPTVRLGVDAKRVSSGAVPFTEAELEKLNRADVKRFEAAKARFAGTVSKGRYKPAPGTEYAELGEGGAAEVNEAKIVKATETVKSKFSGGKTFHLGLPGSRWPKWKVNASPAKIIAFVKQALIKGKAAQALPPKLGKAIFYGFMAWIVGIFIWNTIRLVFGEYGPLGDPATNTAYLNDQKILAAQIVAAGLVWIVIGKGLELMIGMVLQAGIKGASIAGGPLGVALGLILNFVLTGIIVHKMTPMLIGMLEKFGWVPAGTLLSYEEMKAAEAKAREGRQAAIKARQGVAATTITASGLQQTKGIKGGDFGPGSWTMGRWHAETYREAQKKKAAGSSWSSRAWGGVLGLFISTAGAHADVSTPAPSTISGGTFKSLGSMIMGGESAQKGYDDFRRGPNWNDVSHGRAYSKISTLSVGKILDAQEEGILAAVGKYQIIYTTLLMALDGGALGNNVRRAKRQKFNKVNQDKLFKWLLLSKRPAIKRYMENKGSLLGAQIALAKEWASVAMPIDYAVYDNGKYVRTAKKGESYYAHLGNKALIAADAAALQLSAARQQVLAQSGGTDTNAGGDNGGTTVVYTDYGDNFMTQATTNFHPWKAHLGIPNQAIAY